MTEIDAMTRLPIPAETEPEISGPNTAPAYYLGRPARLWITVMRPRRKAGLGIKPVADLHPAAERDPQPNSAPPKGRRSLMLER